MYQSKYYTCEEIDDRLIKGYYDDAVSNGYSRTFEQFKLELASQEIVNLNILNNNAGYTSAEAISKINELYPALAQSHKLTFIFFDKTYSRERRFKYKGSDSSKRENFVDDSNYVFTVGELNGDDGSIDIKPLILEVQYGFTGSAYITGSSGRYGGKLILFTDDMANVIHQLLFTSFLISRDGTKITNTHVDEKTFIYERFLNISSSTNQDMEGNNVDIDTYSKWYQVNDEEIEVKDNHNTLPSDLEIGDENGNILARFSRGHIQTKNFDSADIKSDIEVEDNDYSDLDISDDKGNIILRLKDGHIQTKNFDSRIG